MTVLEFVKENEKGVDPNLTIEAQLESADKERDVLFFYVKRTNATSMELATVIGVYRDGEWVTKG